MLLAVPKLYPSAMAADPAPKKARKSQGGSRRIFRIISISAGVADGAVDDGRTQAACRMRSRPPARAHLYDHCRKTGLSRTLRHQASSSSMNWPTCSGESETVTSVPMLARRRSDEHTSELQYLMRSPNAV